MRIKMRNLVDYIFGTAVSIATPGVSPRQASPTFSHLWFGSTC